MLTEALKGINLLHIKHYTSDKTHLNSLSVHHPSALSTHELL
jgi:hypothetical protein